jgi:hypothetical protein
VVYTGCARVVAALIVSSSNYYYKVEVKSNRKTAFAAESSAQLK